MDRQINKNTRSEPAIESRIASVGSELRQRLNDVLVAIPGAPHGPVDLARTIGIDKVLASRVIKAARNHDPMAVLHLSPGPDPLRRLLRAAKKGAVARELLTAAEQAIAQFEDLIKKEAGDRSGLEAIICSLLPEAKAEFELRRKQSAFKAMSQLKGVDMDVNLATVILHPSADRVNLDVVWIFGMLGLRRIRPGCRVRYTSRRMGKEESPRGPQTIERKPVEGFDGLRIEDFCSKPLVKIDVEHVEDVVHYTLSGDTFGPHSATDLIAAELSPADMLYYSEDKLHRKRHVFAEINTPAKLLVFDALLHKDVYPDSHPELFIYDTCFEGIANVNDRKRDIDRLDLCDTIQPLGNGVSKFRTTEIPRYLELLNRICDKLDWNSNDFRGYRCRIEYPIYGTQNVMAFDAPRKPLP